MKAAIDLVTAGICGHVPVAAARNGHAPGAARVVHLAKIRTSGANREISCEMTS